MAKIHQGRYAADIDGDFVVFLIGMRVTKPWRPTKWLPVFLAMRRMLKQLKADPEKGLLGAHIAIILGVGPSVVQYWRSYEDLNRFARDPASLHLPRWRWFNKNVGASGDVGIWHETYRVRAGEYECMYGNMPVIGLAAAGRHVPIAEKGQSSAIRIGAATEDDVPVPIYETPENSGEKSA
jgi:hypothetical protein